MIGVSEADIAVIRNSELFDADWYLETYPDVRMLGMDPAEHYLRIGAQLGRNPGPKFDSAYYLAVNPDVAEVGVNPLMHYAKWGKKELRTIGSDIARMNGHLVAVKESSVLESMPGSGVIPRTLQHQEEEIKFDVKYYIEKNTDVAEAGVDPEWHYYANGEKEGRKPNTYFDPVFYSNLNADVRSAGIALFRHYCEAGFHEGRLGSAPLKTDGLIRSNREKPILFVGHDGIQAGSEIVLLEVIKWFYHHTTRRIKLLLLAPGPVANKYAHFADVYVLPNYSVDDGESLKAFIKESFEFIYLNTVVSGRLFSLIGPHDIFLHGDIVTHIHEMEKVLAEHENEMQALLTKTKLWISASPASTQTLCEKYRIAADKVTTVAAFISPVVSEESQDSAFQKEARATLGLSSDAFVVSGCGTVYWRKGADIFIKAARKIKNSTSQKCEFVWLGDGPDKEELINQLTEDERQYIKFVGNRTDANMMLAAADVFFLSSREDPFPLVVLESAQHGIPTVCFEPATGITEFIQQDAGIAVEAIDAGQAAHAIVGLIKDPARRGVLGKKARERLFGYYTTKQQNIKVFKSIKEHTGYKPSVSVIVPFYNHEKFIQERLESILKQPIKDIEIIALDDRSTDNTIEKVIPYLQDSRIKLIQNDINSGSPFKQWEKGIRVATADIVWIAEGDDTCEFNFLQTLLPYFDDPFVNIAAAKTEIIDEKGTLKENALKPYMDMAYPGKFEQSYIRDGFQEINEQLGAMCTLVNASGLLIRKSAFGDTLSAAQEFKICGDWLIYLECLKEGKIAYDVSTRNYFRRHSASQVHKVEGTDAYFKERKAITDYVLTNFYVSKRLLNKAFDAINHEWDRFKYKHPEKVLAVFYDKDQLRSKARLIDRQLHVAFYVHGMTFSKGGIERLAAQLANHLVSQGWQVTIFCRVHRSRNPVYPLYEGVSVVPVFDECNLKSSVDALRQNLIHSDIDLFVPMLSEWLFDPIVEATQNTGIPVIASEHNDPWKIEELWWSHDKRIACFEKVGGIHFLLNKYEESVPKHLRNKVHVIPNGVHIPEDVSHMNRENLIISVGRLEAQKRFDRLIDAVASIQSLLRERAYRVEIYGEGSLYQALYDQIQAQGVSDLVSLQGKTTQIEAVYQRASLFVLPSEFEGFGIVLIEALSYGLPAIAFRECNGPNEIIRDEVDGRLVNSVEELAMVLDCYTIKNDLAADRAHAQERAKKYSIKHFYEKWQLVLEKFNKGWC